MWLRHLGLVSEELLAIHAKMKNISKSWKQDVLKDKVQRHASGESQLDLEPAHVAEYLEGKQVEAAAGLLRQSAEGRQLSRTERVSIRNTLALQIVLTNAKRSGDVTHLRREAVMNASSPDGGDVEIEVCII